jgi:predicted esterase
MDHSDSSSKDLQNFTLSVQRTARCYQLGAIDTETQEVWIVCHGYGQLAEYFLKNFQPIAHRNRVIVAPEGLSRFYLKGTEGRVGASWMTKEDRLQEIQDQIAYLNQLWQTLRQQVASPESLRLHVLGFSQGAATIWRWINQGEVTPDSMILWAGMIPQEMGRIAELNIPLHAAIGDQDPYINPERAQAFEAILNQTVLSWQLHRFSGGHGIEPATLRKIAAAVTAIPEAQSRSK